MLKLLTSVVLRQQARNQEFFRVSSNQGTFINVHLQHEKEKPRREKYTGFPLETLKNFILNEKLYPQMTTIRAIFLQIWAFFSNFQKRAGETSPLPPLVTPLGSIKKILHSPYCIYFKCSKFKQMFKIQFHFAFFFISTHKALYRQNFFE